MKHTLYYFSGTGNSLYIAKRLADQLGESQLVPLAKASQQSDIIASTEHVGFVFPVYFWGLPEIVVNFVQKINLEKADYIFAVLSCGGVAGYAVNHLEKLLKAKSKTLNVGCHIAMPGNYIIPSYYKYTYADQEKQKVRFEKANERIDKIAQTIKEQRTMLKKNGVILNLITRLVNKLFYVILGEIHLRDKKYYADDTCNACGICEKLCPVNNIVLSEGKPHWQHNCQQCMACIQLCPQEAIQYAKQTAQKPRYHHPDISLKDIMQQST
jgi:flavodoxin/NAD-dependent dihydropyrimidine dehydrogenase PreA subunit